MGQSRVFVTWRPRRRYVLAGLPLRLLPAVLFIGCLVGLVWESWQFRAGRTLDLLDSEHEGVVTYGILAPVFLLANIVVYRYFPRMLQHSSDGLQLRSWAAARTLYPRPHVRWRVDRTDSRGRATIAFVVSGRVQRRVFEADWRCRAGELVAVLHEIDEGTSEQVQDDDG